MTTLFVRHRVADYPAWRQVYDGFGEMQKRLGVQAQTVYQGLEDPLDITVVHDFATPEVARAFAASPELHDAMGKAGVVGAPEVWFTSKT